MANISCFLTGFLAACGPGAAIDIRPDSQADPTSTGVDATTTVNDPPPSGSESLETGTDGANVDSDTGAGTETGPGPGSTSTGLTDACRSPSTDAEDLFGVGIRPLQGEPDALVTIVEWLGYEEPYSRQAEPTMQTLLASASEGTIRRVVRQIPFAFSPNGMLLARAAIAARAQESFWELHDAMFAYPGTLDQAAVDALALELGLTVDQLHTDMQSEATQMEIDADIALLTELTQRPFSPAFFVNGLQLNGAQPLEVFETAVLEEAAAMNALIDGGLTHCEAYTQRLVVNAPQR